MRRGERGQRTRHGQSGQCWEKGEETGEKENEGKEKGKRKGKKEKKRKREDMIKLEIYSKIAKKTVNA